jgi:protein TonB
MGITFQKAILLSLAFHAAFLAPLWRHENTREPVKKETLVDYVVIKEPEKPKEPIEDKALNIPETPKVELKPKVETAPAPDAPVSRTEDDRDSPREMAEKQARIKTTKDYIGYYQLLREKIRSNVKRRYRSYYGEGEVRMNFVLNSGGKLTESAIDETASSKDRTLKEIALSSLREASPFPKFPGALSLPRMSFDVTIVFDPRQESGREGASRLMPRGSTKGR